MNTTKTARLYGKCKLASCGDRWVCETTRVFAPLLRRNVLLHLTPNCPKCGTLGNFSEVNATLKPEVKCDERCWYATGNKCECSCFGAHHGEGQG
jgi:hypothetical protein